MKNLLIPPLFVIFTYFLSAQVPFRAQGCQSDTVATILIINSGRYQVVKCYSVYEIAAVQRIVVEFFNTILYPTISYGINRPKSYKVKKT